MSSCRSHHETDGKMIFRYNEAANITSLDPAFAKNQSLNWACSQLYNSLVQLDSNLEVQPCIAKRWTISPDGKTYTFILRNDVCFHTNPLFKTADSTRHVVAGDFLYSLNRIIDPDVASPGMWIFGMVDSNGFEAVDDTTFVIHLKQPYAPFLGLLSMPYCSVVPHEVVEYYGADYRSHPCGTGPFRLQMWKEDVKLVMRRNPLYFERDSIGRQLPYLDAVSITFVIDHQTAFLEFIKGNLDFMNAIDASYKDELLTRTGQLKPKYAQKLNMVSTPFLNTEYLGFVMDGEDSPVSDRRIRQAINYGFDRVKMMKYLRNGIGAPGTGGFIPRGLPGHDSTCGYPYNPSLARQLLAEAGYPNGKGLKTITLSTTANYLDICKYIQQQLQLLGIDIKIDVCPPAALSEQVAQGKSPWFRKSWIADYPDAENYLSLFYSPNRAPAGPNYTHFSNQTFDNLYQQSIACANPEQRVQLYRQMDKIVMTEAPVMVLYYDQILHFTHKNVSGLRSNALNALDLRYVTIGCK
ncbi:MAG: ABC transporter substrate-binding protein [Bacteroidales bacterium]|nr:ABC transporter substrate-binding protein [Candidatus Colimorpha onthohippi]